MLVFAVALAAPTLAVLDPGAEPRAVLRFEPVPGAVESVSLRLSLSATMTNEGVTLPEQALPPMNLRVDATVLPAEGGNHPLRVVVRSIDVEAVNGGDDIREALTESLKPLVGMSAVTVVDPQGWPVSTRWETDPQADPELLAELRRCVELTRTVLPKVPVGDGASWTLTETTTEQGFVVHEVETVTLDLDGDRWILDQQILQRADAPQTVGDAVLERHAGSGNGRTVARRDQMLPSEAVMGLTTRSRMLIAGQVRSVTVTGMELSIRRSPAGP